MPIRRLVPLCLVVALAGCSVSAPTNTGVPSAAAAKATATTTTPASAATLPFRTLLADEGQGLFLSAGTPEMVVLRSKSDLDAFLARHPKAQAQNFGPPNPSASPTPPPGPAFLTSPPFAPNPLPPALTTLDFGKYEAIVFFDGAVKIATTSRILAVQDAGGHLEVITQRWEAPPNPSSAPDVNGRLHIVALARTDRAVAFPATITANGAARRDEGGYGIGGNPTMHPRWPAVANPEITREQIERNIRAGLEDSKVTSFDLQLAPVSTAAVAGVGGHDGTNFTPDSLVWVAKIKGELTPIGPP
jgi:hypothetical protein